MRCSSIVLTLTMIVGVTVAAQQLADAPSRREALDHYRRGRDLLAMERFEAAAEAFTRSIQKDGLLTVAHYQLGQAYMGLQRFPSAIRAYQGSIDAMRTLHGLEQTNRFDVEKRRDEEIRELRVEINQVLNIDPVKRVRLEQRMHDLENQRTTINGPFRAPAEVLLALGSAHFRNGDRDAAELEWKAAISANPKLGEAHNNLAVILMQSQRYDEAEAEIIAAEKAGFRVNPQFKTDLRNARR
jgi:tetratricopeptide (TPR) repeat protein